VRLNDPSSGGKLQGAVLVELSVHNWVIVEDARLRPSPGLNVITGETGAGKSLLVDALAALAGARLDQEVIRMGAEVARVEGVFVPPREALQRLHPTLAEAGIEGEELVVVRELHRGGRGVARINGRVVPVSLLREVGRELVDIHGQAEHLSLLDWRRHRDLLDAFGGLQPLRAQVAEMVGQVRRLRQELSSLEQDQRVLEGQRALLEFQVREIEAASLRPGEEEELREEKERLAHAQAIKEACQSAYHSLYAAEGYSAFDMVGRAQAHLRAVAPLVPLLREVLESLERLGAELEEVARSLRSLAASVEHDPHRLEEVEERLSLISRLKRKYGGSVEEVLRYAAEARARLEELAGDEDRRARLSQALAEAERRAGELALELSQARRQAAQRLREAMAGELQGLGLGHVLFQVEVSQEEDPAGLPCEGRRLASTEAGVDRVEFLVATNPGEPLRPLARVASGGEMSRFMLALESVLAAAHQVPLLVFDEIDVGVGGRSADVVGRKLWGIAQRHQVICITHLPHIAAYADAHFRVRKDVMLGRSLVQVDALEEQERVQELAAMLGGPRPSERMLAGARELLARARRWKEGLST